MGICSTISLAGRCSPPLWRLYLSHYLATDGLTANSRAPIGTLAYYLCHYPDRRRPGLRTLQSRYQHQSLDGGNHWRLFPLCPAGLFRYLWIATRPRSSGTACLVRDCASATSHPSCTRGIRRTGFIVRQIQPSPRFRFQHSLAMGGGDEPGQYSGEKVDLPFAAYSNFASERYRDTRQYFLSVTFRRGTSCRDRGTELGTDTATKVPGKHRRGCRQSLP